MSFESPKMEVIELIDENVFSKSSGESGPLKKPVKEEKTIPPVAIKLKIHNTFRNVGLLLGG
jgi:hypothetical protein